MKTQLALQLQKLKINQRNALHLPNSNKFSIIFDSKIAATIETTIIRSIAINGLKELVEDDSRFQKYENSLFAIDSMGFSHLLITKEGQNKILQDIEGLLIILSPYILQSNALKVLEYLIRIYEVNIYMPQKLILFLLPFYNSTIFLKIIQNIALKNLPTFCFMANFAEKGLLIPESELAKSIAGSYQLFEMIRQTCVSIMEFDNEGFNAKRTSSFYYNFCSSIILKIITREKELSSNMTRLILTFLSDFSTLGSGVEAIKIFLEIFGSLATKHILSTECYNALIDSIPKIDSLELYEVLIKNLANSLFFQKASLLPQQFIASFIVDKENDIGYCYFSLIKENNQAKLDKFITIVLISLSFYEHFASFSELIRKINFHQNPNLYKTFLLEFEFCYININNTKISTKVLEIIEEFDQEMYFASIFSLIKNEGREKHKLLIENSKILQNLPKTKETNKNLNKKDNLGIIDIALNLDQLTSVNEYEFFSKISPIFENITLNSISKNVLRMYINTGFFTHECNIYWLIQLLSTDKLNLLFDNLELSIKIIKELKLLFNSLEADKSALEHFWDLFLCEKYVNSNLPQETLKELEAMILIIIARSKGNTLLLDKCRNLNYKFNFFDIKSYPLDLYNLISKRISHFLDLIEVIIKEYFDSISLYEIRNVNERAELNEITQMLIESINYLTKHELDCMERILNSLINLLNSKKFDINSLKLILQKLASKLIDMNLNDEKDQSCLENIENNETERIDIFYKLYKKFIEMATHYEELHEPCNYLFLNILEGKVEFIQYLYNSNENFEINYFEVIILKWVESDSIPNEISLINALYRLNDPKADIRINGIQIIKELSKKVTDYSSNHCIKIRFNKSLLNRTIDEVETEHINVSEEEIKLFYLYILKKEGEIILSGLDKVHFNNSQKSSTNFYDLFSLIFFLSFALFDVKFNQRIFDSLKYFFNKLKLNQFNNHDEKNESEQNKQFDIFLDSITKFLDYVKRIELSGIPKNIIFENNLKELLKVISFVYGLNKSNVLTSTQEELFSKLIDFALDQKINSLLMNILYICKTFHPSVAILSNIIKVLENISDPEIFTEGVNILSDKFDIITLIEYAKENLVTKHNGNKIIKILLESLYKLAAHSPEISKQLCSLINMMAAQEDLDFSYEIELALNAFSHFSFDISSLDIEFVNYLLNKVHKSLENFLIDFNKPRDYSIIDEFTSEFQKPNNEAIEINIPFIFQLIKLAKYFFKIQFDHSIEFKSKPKFKSELYLKLVNFLKDEYKNTKTYKFHSEVLLKLLDVHFHFINSLSPNVTEFESISASINLYGKELFEFPDSSKLLSIAKKIEKVRQLLTNSNIPSDYFAGLIIGLFQYTNQTKLDDKAKDFILMIDSIAPEFTIKSFCIVFKRIVELSLNQNYNKNEKKLKAISILEPSIILEDFKPEKDELNYLFLNLILAFNDRIKSKSFLERCLNSDSIAQSSCAILGLFNFLIEQYIFEFKSGKSKSIKRKKMIKLLIDSRDQYLNNLSLTCIAFHSIFYLNEFSNIKESLLYSSIKLMLTRLIYLSENNVINESNSSIFDEVNKKIVNHISKFSEAKMIKKAYTTILQLKLLYLSKIIPYLNESELLVILLPEALQNLLESNNNVIVASSLACFYSIVKKFSNSVLLSINPFINKAISLMKNLDSSESPEIICNCSIESLSGFIETSSKFIENQLESILENIFLIKSLSQELDEKIINLCKIIGEFFRPKILLKKLVGTSQMLENCDYLLYSRYFAILNKCLNRIDSSFIEINYEKLFDFIILIMAYIPNFQPPVKTFQKFECLEISEIKESTEKLNIEESSQKEEDLNAIEDEFCACYSTILQRINAKMLRIFLKKILTWSNVENSEQYSYPNLIKFNLFIKIVNVNVKILGNLSLSHSLLYLDKLIKFIEMIGLKFAERENELPSFTSSLLKKIINHITEITALDTNGIVIPISFDKLYLPLTNLLNCSGFKEKYDEIVGTNLHNCFCELAQCLKEDDQAKQLICQIIMKVRSEKPIIRLNCLNIIESLAKKMEARMLIFIKDIINYLTEALEDENDAVSEASKRILKFFETITGESIDTYLN